MSDVIDRIYYLFNDFAGQYIDGVNVALSRYHFARYSKLKPWVNDYLTNLRYLDSRYHLEDDEHVVAYASTDCSVSRFDLILRVCK